jgi:hypothetical protein
MEIFTDRSAKEEKSVVEIWNKKEISLNFSFKILEKQDANYEEL